MVVSSYKLLLRVRFLSLFSILILIIYPLGFYSSTPFSPFIHVSDTPVIQFVTSHSVIVTWSEFLLEGSLSLLSSVDGNINNNSPASKVSFHFHLSILSITTALDSVDIFHIRLSITTFNIARNQRKRITLCGNRSSSNPKLNCNNRNDILSTVSNLPPFHISRCSTKLSIIYDLYHL